MLRYRTTCWNILYKWMNLYNFGVFKCCQRCHHFGILKYRCMSSFFSLSIFHVYDCHSRFWSHCQFSSFIFGCHGGNAYCSLVFWQMVRTRRCYVYTCVTFMYIMFEWFFFSEQNEFLLDLYALGKANILYYILTICESVFKTLSKLYSKSEPCIHMNNSFVQKSWAIFFFAIFHFCSTQRTGVCCYLIRCWINKFNLQNVERTQIRYFWPIKHVCEKLHFQNGSSRKQIPDFLQSKKLVSNSVQKCHYCILLTG